MKLALVLEDRDLEYQTLKEFLAEVDSQIEPLRFKNFEEFASWFRACFMPSALEPETEGAEGDPKEGEEGASEGEPAPSPQKLLSDGDQVALFIANHRIFGAPHKELLWKVSAILKHKGHLAEGAEFVPSLFVVNQTDKKFQLEDFKEVYISNFLFRPFDQLVCKAKIMWALYGKEALSKVELYKEAPTALVEMRKDIQALELTETGFKVLSSRELPGGRMAKYYSPEFFNNSPKDGLMAVTESGAVPSPNHAGQWEVELKYMGIDTRQIRSLRARLEELTDKKVQDEPVPKAKALAPVGVALLLEDKTVAHQLKEQLEDAYANIHIHTYGNFVDFLMDIDPERGAQELAEEQSQLFAEESATVQFNFASDTFMGVEVDGGKPGEMIFGIPKSQFMSIKSFFLSQLPKEDRVGLMDFWAQGSAELVYTLKIELENSSYLLSLYERQVDGEVMSFKMRLASDAEIRAYMSDKSELTRPLGAVFLSERIADYRDAEYWSGLKQKMIQAGFHSDGYIRLFKVADAAVADPQLAARCEVFDNVFIHPVDRRYLALKMGGLVSGLKPKRERPVEHSSPSASVIQSAVLVSLLQVNEVSLVLRYSRSISPGRFRYFSFWNAKKKQPEIFLAKCVDTEKDPDNKEFFLNYFLLYGLTDQENSFLRGWMIDQFREARAAKNEGA